MNSNMVTSKPTMKQACMIVGGCFVGALLWVGGRSSDGSFFSSRRLLDLDNDYRSHLSKEVERDVDTWFDTSTSQLMSSPCRPENDGYFGSTSGTPLEIKFGFELETEDEETVEFLLEEIHEQIVDVVLSSTFPNLCGYRRRQERARLLSGMRGLSYDTHLKEARPRTTGYKFGMKLQERADICRPLVDPTNLCGIYKNYIAVYGKHLSPVGEQLLTQVKETLNGEQQRLAEDGLVRLSIVDSFTGQTGTYGDSPRGIHALSFAAKAAIGIFAIAVLAGVATFALYIYLERKKYQLERPSHRRGKQELKKASSNRTLGCEEASQASRASEAVDFRGGTAVVLEDGRPVVIEFGKEFQRKKKDPIEEERSECGNTTLSGSSSNDSPPRHNSRRGRTAEESKLEDSRERYALPAPNGRRGNEYGVQPADPMSQSIYSEYTVQTASRHGEFT